MKNILIYLLIICANFVKASEQAASASSSHEEEIASPGNEEQEGGGIKAEGLTHEALVELDKKLKTASWRGNRVQVRELILEGAPINGIKSKEKYGPKAEPALYVAAQRGKTDMVRLLIDMKADPNVRSIFQSIPVVFFTGKPGILSILLKAKGNPNVRRYDGDTPLHQAVFFRETEAVRLLLQHGADPRAQNSNAVSPSSLPKCNKESKKLLEEYERKTRRTKFTTIPWHQLSEASFDDLYAP